jgi:hypothetical protein
MASGIGPGGATRQANRWARQQTTEQQRAAAEARRLAQAQSPAPVAVPHVNPHLAKLPTIVVDVTRAERAAASEAEKLVARAAAAKAALVALEREYRASNRYERAPLLPGLVAAEKAVAEASAAALAAEVRVLEARYDANAAAYAGLSDLAPPLLARQEERRAEVTSIEQDIADLEAATSWITYHVGLGATARAELRHQINDLVRAGEVVSSHLGAEGAEVGWIDPNADELKQPAPA